MTSKLSEFQKHVGEWNVATFPDSSTTGHMNHIKQEVDELDAELKLLVINPTQSIRNVAEEAADVFILLLSLAHKFGFDLLTAASDKHRILKNRTWHPPDVNGIHHHIAKTTVAL
jgi:NTP pyrophosphatase (non-canonical NTP hydrolase)